MTNDGFTLYEYKQYEDLCIKANLDNLIHMSARLRKEMDKRQRLMEISPWLVK